MEIEVHETRRVLGTAAARAVAAEIRHLIAERGRAVGLFASAVSQDETLEALVTSEGVDWRRVTAFHLDEYLGMDEQSPQSFRRYLREHLVSRVPLGAFHGLQGEAEDPELECERYAALLGEKPPDFALLGIGENGHLAFNDPPVADFDDPLTVKVVELDEVCRQQQVHDGAFASLDEVPRRALTLTISAIVKTPKLYVVVPGARKKPAVEAALHGPVTTECPASALQRHPDARLFLDVESGVELPGR